ncbi:DUF2848 domain-containing protein [Herbaspirillum sp.]|uniref:DUF2848 domain-containing protein n=1 Tax=Herbaspirillum sp. TaxID=1890675 RepID=UPI0031CE7778
MKLSFSLPDNGAVNADIHTLVIAGWAGRDMAAIEHHIEELEALGISRPSAVPLFYRVSANQLTQEKDVQVLGGESSGEVETFVFNAGGELYVSIASDHTDRKLEAHSVAFSKQACVKPVGASAWKLSEVADYWDELMIRSWIEENGATMLYQEGPLSSLRTPSDLIARFTGGQAILPEGCGMTCGTVGAIGGIRPAASFTMELFDPRRGRSLRHGYVAQSLAEVA